MLNGNILQCVIVANHNDMCHVLQRMPWWYTTAAENCVKKNYPVKIICAKSHVTVVNVNRVNLYMYVLALAKNDF